jgi:hypothetical protein
MLSEPAEKESDVCSKNFLYITLTPAVIPSDIAADTKALNTTIPKLTPVINPERKDSINPHTAAIAMSLGLNIQILHITRLRQNLH